MSVKEKFTIIGENPRHPIGSLELYGFCATEVNETSTKPGTCGPGDFHVAIVQGRLVI